AMPRLGWSRSPTPSPRCATFVIRSTEVSLRGAGSITSVAQPDPGWGKEREVAPGSADSTLLAATRRRDRDRGAIGRGDGCTHRPSPGGAAHGLANNRGADRSELGAGPGARQHGRPDRLLDPLGL